MSALETERRYIWGCSSDEGPLDYNQTISGPIGVSPSSLLSQSTSLSRWHFGKSHCHTTFNKDKSLRQAAGDEWPDRASVRSIPHITSFTHVLRVFHWERPPMWVQNTTKTHKQVCASTSMGTDGTSAHQHTDTLFTLKFVVFFLSLPGYAVYTHSTSPPDCQTAASSMLSAEPRLKQKRRRARPTVSESEEVGADYAAPEEAFRSC